MARHPCHDQPHVLSFDSDIVAAEPGAVLLRQSFFYPGGGGQLPDRGRLLSDRGAHTVVGIVQRGDDAWLLLDRPVELAGRVRADIDPGFRDTMCQLHTGLHIVNALVFQAFDGALVTGVQMNDDRTARIDFDLPDADNELIRRLEPAINDAIRQDLPVRITHASPDQLRDQPGLLRSRSVAPPPQADGSVRIVEIEGLDRQACGGTHLASTGASPPIRILKIENKGRHNRRVRIGLA